MKLNPTFSEFIADSKVVDQAGAPVMVFHGASAAFEAFDKAKQVMMPRFWGRPGFFFTSSAAEAHANAVWANIYRRGAENVIPVYLSLKNPIVRKAQGFPQKWFDANWRALMEQAKRNGNDGFILNGSGPGEGRATYIAFEPEQIVSAVEARAAMALEAKAVVAAEPAPEPASAPVAAPRRRMRA